MTEPNGIRVALATCHDKRNYGSMLQAWATQRFLEESGYDVRTIDKTGLGKAISVGRMEHYARNFRDTAMYSEKVPFALHRVRQRVSHGFGRDMAARRASFDGFARECFRLTRKTFDFDEARELSAEYDAVVVGSDQLWLPVNIAGDYFTLSWVDPGVRKVAYATSFGISGLDGWTGRRVGDFLSGYHAVSVREESGAEIVRGLTGRRPEVVCDPTMLLDAGQWRDVACSGNRLVPDEPYVLAYFLGRNAWQREVVEAYAHARGLKIVAIAHNDSFVKADEGYADVYPWEAGPAEWIDLIDNAQLVCTDSFHGTVFSSILETPFISFRRHAGGVQSTNSRMDTLLGLLGLFGRLCEDAGEFGRIVSGAIDFSEPRERIGSYREASAEWLLQALDFGDRKVPEHIAVHHAEECCGCSACAAACPLGCVRMTYDAVGCEYPDVDETLCIGCGKCIAACPVINGKAEVVREQHAYLVQHNDSEVLAESTSGGAMTAFAQAVIENGGIVFGAGYLDEVTRSRAGDAPGRLVVGHFGVDAISELGRFRNSKYVQSAIGPSYEEAKAELEAGREVLFIGTPCQCEGLLAYLGARPSKLRVADVVCRAVVCRRVFSSYMQWLDGEYGAADDLRFRDKSKYGYSYSSIRAVAHEGDGSVEELYSAGVESDPYLRAFFGNLSDRPICYSCPFKKRYRESDLTCWDCFDVAKFGSGLDDNRGVTRVLVQSEAGQELLERASDYLKIEGIDAEAAVGGVREMMLSVKCNPQSTSFKRDVALMKPEQVVAKWLPDSMRVRAERMARRLAQRTGTYDRMRRVAKKVLGN